MKDDGCILKATYKVMPIFGLKRGGEPRRYSFWAPNSILAFAYVHQNKELVIDLLPHFDQNYKEWEKSVLDR